MLNVVKRDGRQVVFDSNKIFNAIKGAADEIGYDIKQSDILELTQKVIGRVEDLKIREISVEEVQNLVEEVLLENGNKEIGMAYCTYRKERTKVREIKSDLMKVIEKIGIETDRDNANVGNNYSSKLLRIASESNKWHNLSAMPKKISRAHENGDIYLHDLDSYNLSINCLHIPTKEVLQSGFNTGYGYIRPPKRIESAAELSCILLQSTQNDMFGGQSHPDFDNDMAEFIEETRRQIRHEYEEIGVEADKLDEYVEKKLVRIVGQSMQGIVYNLNTMHSRAGSQVPFSSINIGIPQSKDAALVCEIFLKEYEKGLGNGEQPIFPNIIFRVKSGVNRNENDPYYYLFKLACRVAAKRMNPTFMNIDADFNKEYYDKGYIPATMGCRTYLMSNINGEPGVKGRGNIAPTTVNLPRIGILAKGDVDKFFELLHSRLEIAKESLLHRYSVLKKLKVKDLPFVVGQNLMKGSENLKPDDSIEPVLKQGTWGVGFIGLAETLVALTGHHHGETEEAKELGIKIVSYIRDYLDDLKKHIKLNWSCYATPAEGLSGKFIAKDKVIFGEIPGVTDKDYYTNSYHVPVGFDISIKEKINIEAPYHKLCNGGHISYIELDDYGDEETIMNIIKYAYENTNINYIGINFHIRYCKDCGEYLDASDMKCKKCGSHDIQGISRVTGYLSLDERFGVGKAAERADRISQGTAKHCYK
ncbi:ribonucleoside-triphosphate reductase [Clostridium acetobutylicum]|uniref:Oxygen-sensitive ribonucleoside-triphosphate reductase nrdD n=1 Tax=Clostridium acetobutylicum (strain ATCC 824 / DSM 792 / JCM 1419 / IAM 19013 / LMG 5710 / NBRC 13948 / NRRL B-527 / VKM B-1787 / 2291 / W) TaxID=272562 RepID=Q97LS4_CLOAB|nr:MULTISPECIES: anaerobic ribonucleoside triphosphate reductase [Clostridium]AAK78460.1 Oxygen-sensitive ribonucleoside-triphosphate reductase nrdD [Clostridium acetobutylicum ATCC 824]ADZ19530.1 anaerobic ribonucleoside triphosphate reductase [Clostridium acetobutylicum EA 2018]AEI34324.1 anaerobic ribonucleoside triphosphate reductase [Clostridium acetobutylicum DSM 1731]AWV80182.1 anaerobic ribonucleoside triphosphate reductase [Clostridium acetobutylicum]MBC2392363.1 anaerobic ribonucleos